MNNYTIAGYTGLFKQPISDLALYGPTMFAVSDINKRELDLIILTPNCFYDAYKIIKQCGFPTVRLFCPTMNYLFISDISLLLGEFSDYSGVKDVKLIYPDRIKIPISNIVHDNIIGADIWENKFDTNIRISYLRTISDITNDCYDIYLENGSHTYYFSLNYNEEKLNYLCARKDDIQIHINYDNKLFSDGLNYLQIKDKYKKYLNRFYVHTFVSDAEYKEAVKARVQIGKSISISLGIGGIRGVVPYSENTIPTIKNEENGDDKYDSL